MRFTVCSLDVWGNEADGWEVNNQHQIGAINIDDAVFNDDQLILDVLNQSGFLDSATTNEVQIDGDEYRLDISELETGRPVISLISEQ